MEGYIYVASRNGFQIYRKIENGRGLWMAEKDGVWQHITYQQALGYEPIGREEALQKFLGKMLLPT